MEFDLPKNNSSIIKVIGVGGGGSNAVNHMFEQGIRGVDFMVCNTDQQALDASPVPHKIQLGTSLTEGRGAGSIPEVGRNAALENVEEIRELLTKNAKMVFVTAGMGGGTGTGAAPVLAKIAREMGILTVGIVTMPFFFEGRKRRQQADAGVEAMREAVDTLLVINNDKLREMYGNLSLAQAFTMADDVLATAAKGIAEIITRTGYINVDFEDVRTVMVESGVAIMGSATEQGEDRAMKAVEKALASPLLNDNQIKGARYVLLNITFGNQEVLMDEISDITDFIQDEAGSTADVIWGYGPDESLGDDICVTVIATGFNTSELDTGGFGFEKQQEKKVVSLEEERPTTLTAPVEGQQTPPPAATEPSIEPYLKPQAPASEPASAPEPPRREQQPTIEFDLTAKQTPATPEPPVQQTPPAAPEPEPAPVNQAPEPASEPRLPEPPSPEPVAPEPQESLEPYLKSEGPQAPTPPPAPRSTEPARNPEDHQKRASERIMKLKDLSQKLRTPSGIAELEDEPAYKRRQVRLDDTPHSSESHVSRYTLSEEENEDGDKRTGLRPNNAFLHDKPD